MNRILLLLGLNFIFCAAFAHMPMDSVGVTTKSGKTYIQHKVEKGETLYALSRKYNQSVDEIKASNGNSTALNVGEIILIPSKAAAKSSTSTTSSQKTHTVQKGETLYSISRSTGVSVGDIKKLNGLSDNEISLGQTLKLIGSASTEPTKSTSSAKTHVVQKGETLYSISRETGVSVTDIKKLNNMKDAEISVGQTLALGSGVTTTAAPVKKKEVVDTTPAKPTTTSSSSAQKHTVKKGETLFSVSQKYNVQVNDLIKANNLTSSSLNEGQVLLIPATGIAKADPEKIEKKEIPAYKTVDKPTKTAEADYFSKKRYERISEEGTANSWNGGSLESKYSYCLHKTAPIGTVIKITNKTNERFVYARVIGNDVQGANLITVNKTVQNRLETKSDEVFNTAISYVK